MVSVQNSDPTPISPEFWGCSNETSADVVALRNEDPELIIGVIIFELTQHIYVHGTSTSRTDGRTEERMTYCSNTTQLNSFLVT